MKKKAIFGMSFYLVYFFLCIFILDIGEIVVAVVIAVIGLFLGSIPLPWEREPREEEKVTGFGIALFLILFLIVSEISIHSKTSGFRYQKGVGYLESYLVGYWEDILIFLALFIIGVVAAGSITVGMAEWIEEASKKGGEKHE